MSMVYGINSFKGFISELSHSFTTLGKYCFPKRRTEVQFLKYSINYTWTINIYRTRAGIYIEKSCFAYNSHCSSEGSVALCWHYWVSVHGWNHALSPKGRAQTKWTQTIHTVSI